MIEAAPPYKVALEPSELEYLIKKKDESIAGLTNALKFFLLLIIIITVIAAIGMYIIIRLSPDTFTNRGEPPPNILTTCMELMCLLLGVVAIASYYSYHKTLHNIIKDIKSGQKTIEPCAILRKLHSAESGTYNVYITSVIRISVQVAHAEYLTLSEGDIINLEYSSLSKIYFGYFI